jgi:hypothetical protein
MSARRFVIASVMTVLACARGGPPLPGDSVTDAGIRLTPPRFSTATSEAPLGSIESKLFTADVVMEHQAAIGVDRAQRDALLKEIDRAQSEIARLQWDLQGEKEKLAAVLDTSVIDEAKAMAQASRVMDAENRVKSAHLVMLVRIKNLLTPDQQKKLRELRDEPHVATDASTR